ncbi:MAG: DNA repair protein RecN [candidate division Zixibacteria bacterium]
MLTRLHIGNFALIDSLDIEFGKELNVITGPTGVGKSIIIEGLSLVLGGRVSEVMLRTGESGTVIEAHFSINDQDEMAQLMDLAGVSPGDQTLKLRREYRKKSGSRAFINGLSVNLATLKEVSRRLVSILGQHSHQSLLDSSSHLKYLDSYAQLDGKISRLKVPYDRALDLVERISFARKYAREIADRIDLLNFQVNEIERSVLKPDEEDVLKQEKKILENSRRIREVGGMADSILLESDGSVVEKLGEIQKTLTGIPDTGSTFENIIGQIKNASDSINEAVAEIRSLIDGIDDDPARLEQISERLDEIFRLKKKYGGDIKEILRYGSDSRNKLAELEDKAGDTEKLDEDLQKTLLELNRLAGDISKIRKDARTRLENLVCENLASMGMTKAQFVVEISNIENEQGLYSFNGRRLAGDSSGFDSVEFQFCANPGEGLKPLASIASGGEISRVMLALKNSLLAGKISGCEVFDEIDVGISGEIAARVAHQLKALSKNHQVICITHLQQIASSADHHYRVYKQRIGGRSVTRIKKLDSEERIKEVASLLSGEAITESAIAGAREMLKNSRRER